ncbi:hypothetical protein [Mycobacterium sp.]|uniref:hypothetical protein n=1 Tax=Mycobacterium sp. TaxID=1785 RepID=UPI003A836224
MAVPVVLDFRPAFDLLAALAGHEESDTPPVGDLVRAIDPAWLRQKVDTATVNLGMAVDPYAAAITAIADHLDGGDT